MITEPRWKSYIVQTNGPLFTPEQCNKIIQAGRSEPKNRCKNRRQVLKMEREK
jgi:hypothetical protein